MTGSARSRPALLDLAHSLTKNYGLCIACEVFEVRFYCYPIICILFNVKHCILLRLSFTNIALILYLFTYLFLSNFYWNQDLHIKQIELVQSADFTYSCKHQAGMNTNSLDAWDCSSGSVVSSECGCISLPHTKTLSLTFNVRCDLSRGQDQRPSKKWMLAWRRTSCGSGRVNARLSTLPWPATASGKEPRACCRSVIYLQ